METYELYFDLGDTVMRFEPLTCRPEDLIRLTRDLLSARGAAEVKVEQAGVRLFDLVR